MVLADLSCTGIGLGQPLTCEECSDAGKNACSEWKTAAGSCKVCCSAVTSANAIAGGPLGPVVSVVPSAFRGGGAEFF